MKTNVILNFLFAIGCVSAEASIIVPGANGTDGSLTITQDTVIDLSQAPTGSWDQDNSANAGKGVYDPEKWAVVFKFTEVTIAAGTKVTFKNNASRAPVVWLVSGNVAIHGTLDISGESAQNVWSSSSDGWAYHPVERPRGGRLTEPGPGGFRGGAAWRGGNALNGAGFGVGGGRTGLASAGWVSQRGLSGAFGSPGSRWDWWGMPANAYGNPSLVPLIGGSGGGGAGPEDPLWGRSGGAGGGAILIGCQNEILFSAGQIRAKGGDADGERNGAGSGGGVRLVCAVLSGNGDINASGGTGSSTAAGVGRVRLERSANTGSLNVTPAASSIDIADGATALLWPPTGSPSAKVLSVNSVDAPADPNASFGSYTPDVALPLVSSVVVVVETRNVEPESTVIVRVTPRNGMVVNTTDTNGNPTSQNRSDANEATAVVDSEYVPETPGVLHWKATLPTLPGYSAVQARIVRP